MSNAEIVLSILTVVVIAIYFIMQAKKRPSRMLPPTFSQLEWRQFVDDDLYPDAPMEKPDFKVNPNEYIPWGKVASIHFTNGFGVSVVRHYGSYGGDSGRYELAVLRLRTEAELAERRKGDDSIWTLAYNTDITNDVIGWLYEREVTETMQRIWLLNPDGTEPIPYKGDVIG